MEGDEIKIKYITNTTHREYDDKLLDPSRHDDKEEVVKNSYKCIIHIICRSRQWDKGAVIRNKGICHWVHGRDNIEVSGKYNFRLYLFTGRQSGLSDIDYGSLKI